MRWGNTAPAGPATHAWAIKAGATDVSVFNKLIAFYSKSPSDALRLFAQIPSPDLVSWTSIITAHASSPFSLSLFLSMLRRPLLPSQRTLATLLNTCASLPSLHTGLQLHSLALKLSLSYLPFSGTALLHMYSKCRLPDDARKVFDRIPHKDDVCYSAAIVGLAQNGRPEGAISVFAGMRLAGVGSNVYSVSGALRAAAEVASLEQCRVLHAHAAVAGLEANLVVGTALVDAYGKSGVVEEARRAFDGLLPGANVVGWNAVISAYALQGDSGSAVELFHQMLSHGVDADELSFLAILTAFSNSGLVLEAEQWLDSMNMKYGVQPGLEHYTCVVGAMARAGRITDAENLINAMPFEPDDAVWRTLLSACAVHGAADVGMAVGCKLLGCYPRDDAAYVMLANINAASGRWDEMAKVWRLMKDRRVRKEGGQSWLEVQGNVHTFLAGDRGHKRTAEIYAKLGELMEEIANLGYREAS
ncbi:hypothetical protein ACLOJK_007681 [Asimina triloba]